MENYVGKICPFCKTEITETDAVKVCPACGIPHHEGCWNENRGCTTFGCSEQYYEGKPVAAEPVAPQYTAPVDLCSNCGAPLAAEQAFCTNCGAPRAAAPVKNFCGKCGHELTDGQAFCPVCGQRAGLAVDPGVSSAIEQFNAGVNKTNEAQKKKPMKVIIAAIAAIVAVAIFALMAPKIFVSVEELCAQGNYEKAYEKAKDSEKDDVIAENNIAVCSALTVDMLKDSKSFDLREAWYNAEKGYVVLKIAANNSYGNTVINYWLFTYDYDEDKEWELWDAYSDLDKETTSKYDTTEELVEKMVNNLGKDRIKASMTSANKLDSEGVKRINKLFAEDLLADVDQIDEAVPVQKEASGS